MKLRFAFTPEDAQGVAIQVVRWLRLRRIEVRVEASLWEDAPYRPTLIADTAPSLLVEVQGRFSYHRSLADLAAWLMASRKYAELYIAIPSESEIPGHVLERLKQDGVGLWLVAPDGTVAVSHKALNPALRVTPDPTLVYGSCAAEVNGAVKKFNLVDRKDGLRDMCELVERETERLIALAARRGLVTMSEEVARKMDWSSQINALASSTASTPPHQPILSEALKNDFHSFRGARNLVDHPVRTKREDKRRLTQFTERMTQGPRLVAELVALQRRTGRR